MSRQLCGQARRWITSPGLSRDTTASPYPNMRHVDASRVPRLLALPPARGELCQRWRQATKLILDQADVAAISHQVHLALFYDAQLDLKARR